MPVSDQLETSPAGNLGPLAAGLLLVANAFVPLVWGDVYPFTSAPMFRDAPEQCCNYRVFGPDGRELPAEAWLCERVYDGNPVGYGVGIRPPPVIEQQYGGVHDEAAVRAHFGPLLARPENAGLAYVEVVQEVLGAKPDGSVGVVRTERWRIER
jgi:hypothetical protein